jgi:hypothetical protein
MQFKVFTHVSKFTNDLVEKDFLSNKNTLFNSSKGKLPALANKNSKFTNKKSDKLYETRSKLIIF